MNILHIISSLETGGAQRLLADMLPVVAGNDDIKIRLVLYKKSGSALEKAILDDRRIETVFLDVPSIRSPKIISALRTHLRWADTAHVHLFPCNYQTALANIGIGTPLIFTEHSTHNRRRDKQWLRPIEKWVYGRYSIIAAISPATKETLSSWLGLPGDTNRITIVENGADLTKFQDVHADAKEVFGRSGKPLLMISRFTESKDQSTVVRALSRMKEREAFVAFAGNGNTMEKVKDIAREACIENRVLFLGTRTDIPRLVAAAEIGIQSSNWEGFGLTAVEMMAGGLPVVASDVDGLRQVVEGAGILFKAGDAEALACILDNLLTNEPALKELTEKGSARATEYSISETARKYTTLYKEYFRHFVNNKLNKSSLI